MLRRSPIASPVLVGLPRRRHLYWVTRPLQLESIYTVFSPTFYSQTTNHCLGLGELGRFVKEQGSAGDVTSVRLVVVCQTCQTPRESIAALGNGERCEELSFSHYYNRDVSSDGYIHIF